MEQHAEKVIEISSKARYFHDRCWGFQIYNGSTQCTRGPSKTRTNTIDIRSLSRVLHVDTDERVALVEPNVPMAKLVAATLPYDLIPPVITGLPSLTAGSAYTDTSGASSSFRHGFFDRTVNWIEIVSANGQVMRASTTENADLFYGAAASLGTLGIVTLLEIQLVPAKPYVRLEYRPVSSVSQAISGIQRYTTDTDCQYLDGIMYSRDKGVLCAGYLSDRPAESTSVQRFTRLTDPWFYIHAEEISSRGNPAEEYIPLVDYLSRYDHGGFWAGKWALDNLFHVSPMYHTMHKGGHFGKNTIQNVAVPYKNAHELIDHLDDSFGRYPIWLCPVRQATSSPDGLKVHGLMAQLHPTESTLKDPKILLSIGTWGPRPGTEKGFGEFDRSVERKVLTLGGQKWPYAGTYYTEEEFWSLYDQKHSEQLRRKYNATYLPTLYEESRVRIAEQGWMEMWLLSGLYGLIHSAVRTEYLLGQKKRLNVISGDMAAWFIFLVAGLYYVVTGGGI
ncbi:FAD-binding oxidoreductase [Aspergillus chevalieri]|uniref:Delta(24)-sterol reductase n=1 Tax=Aspergillus chevalieri TaxID=182096 RepID=A0A7R7VWS5_ASPCH|nr:uncharacterized protein ACHE_80102S [Aspergillus chevalieri]BCR92202.1 hypothetical protein ACHE_80102S [Aspergillus chevalieri]